MTSMSLADLQMALLKSQLSPVDGGTAETASTSADVTVAAVSILVLAANANRKRAWIQNTHATAYIRVNLSGGAATAGTGIQVPPLTILKLTGADTVSDITAIRQDSTTVVVTATEFT